MKFSYFDKGYAVSKPKTHLGMMMRTIMVLRDNLGDIRETKVRLESSRMIFNVMCQYLVDKSSCEKLNPNRECNSLRCSQQKCLNSFEDYMNQTSTEDEHLDAVQGFVDQFIKIDTGCLICKNRYKDENLIGSNAKETLS